ncbi:MAG: cytochrome C oxidase subunit IV family protein [Acidobacteriaceae bacterium]|jgi:cytochrome c oxidase subunit 4
MTEKTKETHQDSEVHIVKPPVYLAIFLALLVLTALTTGISFIDLGVFNAVIALAIAVLKASLVVLFFMHIHYSSRLLKLTVAAGLFTFMLLISLTMTDYISRAWGMF